MLLLVALEEQGGRGVCVSMSLVHPYRGLVVVLLMQQTKGHWSFQTRDGGIICGFPKPDR